jgi:very-short-patch-repair endonuclease
VKLPRFSEGEETLAFQIRALQLPLPMREASFHPTRKWRFDFYWPAHRLACEVEGGTQFGKSRHSRGEGFERDAEKYNTAARLGITVLRFTTAMVKDGRAIAEIEKVLKTSGGGDEARA